MSVYVDQIQIWPTTIRCFKGGSCHLTADTLDELHAFARKLGCRKGWFQDTTVPHYDLTPARREKAIELGAVFVSAKDQAMRRRILRAQNAHPSHEPAGSETNRDG